MLYIFHFMALNEVLEKLTDMLEEDVIVKHGDLSDNSMSIDEIEITVVATGFEYSNANSQNPKKDEQNIAENKRNLYVQSLGKTGTFNRDEVLEHIENVPSWLRNQMD